MPLKDFISCFGPDSADRNLQKFCKRESQAVFDHHGRGLGALQISYCF